ncbi:hypothetical protein HSB1_37630 [Halogranum salarium B-1]|uniref:Uncharacterized protein n=1 Tax=Halogranum salarium B-1 TaxID=1210908 RepID=J3JEG5_9EURY|nr:hypothetical protein HSB1_37630 [Halogranum salarium B-1]
MTDGVVAAEGHDRSSETDADAVDTPLRQRSICRSFVAGSQQTIERVPRAQTTNGRGSERSRWERDTEKMGRLVGGEA